MTDETASVQGEGRELCNCILDAHCIPARPGCRLKAGATVNEGGGVCGPRPAVPAPSDERWTIYLCGTSRSPYTCSCGDGDYDTECVGEYAVEVVPAAKLAEARAEGEAARTAEIVAWLQTCDELEWLRDEYIDVVPEAVAAMVAHFNPEANG